MSIRLIILVVVALAFMGLTTAVYKYRGDAIGARAEAARINGELNKAVTANAEAEAAYRELQKQADLDAKLVAELQDDLNAANASTLALATKVAELKSGNPDVKSFLDMPVPAALRELYDRP